MELETFTEESISDFKEVTSSKLIDHFNQSLPLNLSLWCLSIWCWSSPCSPRSRWMWKTNWVYITNFDGWNKLLTTREGRFIVYLRNQTLLFILDLGPIQVNNWSKAIVRPYRWTQAYITSSIARIHHWSLYLSMFQYSFKFQNTTAHGNADALSRLPFLWSQHLMTHLPSWCC